MMYHLTQTNANDQLIEQVLGNEDLASYIFSFLNPNDLLSVRTVCKDFHRLIKIDEEKAIALWQKKFKAENQEIFQYSYGFMQTVLSLSNQTIAPLTLDRQSTFKHFAAKNFLMNFLFNEYNEYLDRGNCHYLDDGRTFQYLKKITVDEHSLNLIFSDRFFSDEQKNHIKNQFQERPLTTKEALFRSPNCQLTSLKLDAENNHYVNYLRDHSDRFSSVELTGDADVTLLLPLLNDEHYHIQSITLFNQFVNINDLDALFQTLANLDNPQVNSLSLKTLHAPAHTDQMINGLVRLFQSPAGSQIKKLCFINNALTDSIDQLTSVLHESNLIRLALYGTKLNDQNIQTLSDTLIHPNCKISSLNLGRNKFTKSMMDNLASVLNTPYHSLRMLDLTLCAFDESNYSNYEEPIIELKRFIDNQSKQINFRNTTVRSLYNLSHLYHYLDNLPRAERGSFFDVLGRTTLHTLILSDAKYTDVDLVHLARAITQPECRLESIQITSSYNDKYTIIGLDYLMNRLQSPNCHLKSILIDSALFPKHNLIINRLIDMHAARRFNNLSPIKMLNYFTPEREQMLNERINKEFEKLTQESNTASTSQFGFFNREEDEIADSGMNPACSIL